MAEPEGELASAESRVAGENDPAAEFLLSADQAGPLPLIRNGEVSARRLEMRSGSRSLRIRMTYSSNSHI